MKLVVLANATDSACETESKEGERFTELNSRLQHIGVRMDACLNLLGRYDYLFIMNVEGGNDLAFTAMSMIAQSGTMRTESFVAMPLDDYFALAQDAALS